MIIARHCQTPLRSLLETYFLSTADISTSDGTKFPENALIKNMMNDLYGFFFLFLTAGRRQVSSCCNIYNNTVTPDMRRLVHFGCLLDCSVDNKSAATMPVLIFFFYIKITNLNSRFTFTQGPLQDNLTFQTEIYWIYFSSLSGK